MDAEQVKAKIDEAEKALTEYCKLAYPERKDIEQCVIGLFQGPLYTLMDARIKLDASYRRTYIEFLKGRSLSFSFNDTLLHVVQSTYIAGERIALRLKSSDGAPFATLTVNMLDVVLAPGEFLVKTWSENEDIAKAAMASGIFVDTGKRATAGHCEAQVWRFKD